MSSTTSKKRTAKASGLKLPRGVTKAPPPPPHLKRLPTHRTKLCLTAHGDVLDALAAIRDRLEEVIQGIDAHLDALQEDEVDSGGDTDVMDEEEEPFVKVKASTA